MKKTLSITALSLTLTGMIFAGGINSKTKPSPVSETTVTNTSSKVVAKKAGDENAKQAKVQIAILLDSSTSMNGLINQARAQLWDVVNTFIGAKVGGKVPFVEVALYTHGQGDGGKDGDHIRQIQPLTRDLDQISTDLFALRTTGSKEYCGAAIAKVTRDLKWDANPKTYKAIFIAGNESFRQGKVDVTKACKDAIAKGILVNTIYCGNEAEGVQGGWKDGALLADGKFAVINQNQAVVQFDAPQDAKIMALNEKLNKTYVTYNKVGAKKLEMQMEADIQNSNAGKNAAVARCYTKASGNYWNASWDLVDAAKDKNFDWTSLKEEELPKELKGLSVEKRKAWIADKRKERETIQKEIKKLGAERNAFVAEKRKELAEKNGDALDTAMQRTVIEQASKQGYTFGKEAKLSK